MTTQPEALRLAEKLAYYGESNDCGMDDNPTKQYMRQAAAELRRLHQLEVALLPPWWIYTPTQRQTPQFPTMLRKMWSGSEVQEWINENWNKGNT